MGDGRTNGQKERERLREQGGGGEGEEGRAGDRGCAERRADNAPCARGTTVSKQNRERARPRRRSSPLSFFYSLLFVLLLLCGTSFFPSFLSADGGVDHRHFSEASRTATMSSRLL